MSPKIRFFLFFALLLSLLWGCITLDPPLIPQEQARARLFEFFDLLAQGEYDAVVDIYAGSYETLVAFNPDLDPHELAALWQAGCEINGLQCLRVRTATFTTVNGSGDYVFIVEFNTPEGDLFVFPACCGEQPTTPPQFQFEYRLVQDGNGQFEVLDLPVYMP